MLVYNTKTEGQGMLVYNTLKQKEKKDGKEWLQSPFSTSLALLSVD